MKPDHNVACLATDSHGFSSPLPPELTSQGNVAALDASEYDGSPCALKTDGSVFCASGAGFSPAMRATSISGVSQNSYTSVRCALETSGAVACTGNLPPGTSYPAAAGPAPPDGLIQESYSHTLTSSAGVPAESGPNAPASGAFDLAGGSLPPGLHLSPTGVISGSPSQEGSFTFTVKTYNGIFDDVFSDLTIKISRRTKTWGWSQYGVPSATASTTGVGNRPPKRSLASMAYDIPRKRTVLFGGNALPLANVTVSPNTYAPRNDTWEWDGTNWARKTFTTAIPGVRQGQAMAFDAARGVTVMFGGDTGTTALSDTWTYDGSIWTQQTVSPAPPARTEATMTYDSVRNKVVLFGGRDGTAMLNDIWEWDGSSWSNPTPTGASPPGRRGPQVTFDPDHNGGETVAVIEGAGYDAVPQTGTYADVETWTWQGPTGSATTGTWTQKTPTTSPPGRRYPSLAYTTKNSVELHGGLTTDADPGKCGSFNPASNPPGDERCDTWVWNGVDWAQESPATSPGHGRGQANMVLDQAHNELLLFGGSAGYGVGDDLWTFKPPVSPASPLSISVSDVNVAEPDSGTVNASFVVSLSGPVPQNNQVNVTYATAAGAAPTATGGNDLTAAGTDYQNTTGTLHFLPGGPLTQTVDVPVKGDTLHEPTETFKLNLSAPPPGGTGFTPVLADASGTATILDNEGMYSLSVSDVGVPEGASGQTTPANFRVSVSPPVVAGEQVTVKYATAAGATSPAAATTDYTPVSPAQTLTFVAGGPSWQTVAVNVLGNDAPNNATTGANLDKTFKVNLSLPSANAVLADGSGTATILDDDAAGVPVNPVKVTFGATDVYKSEGTGGPDSNMTFKVKASRPLAAGESATVKYTIMGGTPAATNKTATNVDPPTYDYSYGTPGAPATTLYTATFTSSTLTDPADGLPYVPVDIPVRADNLHEVNEQILLTLSAPAGINVSAAVADGAATGTILDDDGKLSLSVRETGIAEGNPGDAHRALFSVELSGTPAPGERFTFKFNTGAPAAVSRVNGSSSANAVEGIYPAALNDYTARFTATAPSDPVAFDAFSGTTQIVPVTITGDLFHEFDEAVQLNMSAPGGANLADSAANAKIFDEEGPFQATILDANQSPSVMEGTNTTGVTNPSKLAFTVNISPPPIAGETGPKVAYATGYVTGMARLNPDDLPLAFAGTTADYIAAPAGAGLSFSTGQTVSTAQVTVVGDSTAATGKFGSPEACHEEVGFRLLPGTPPGGAIAGTAYSTTASAANPYVVVIRPSNNSVFGSGDQAVGTINDDDYNTAAPPPGC